MSIQEDLKDSRLDWQAAKERYEEILAIAGAKQVVLYKFVERIQTGKPAAPIDQDRGEWPDLIPVLGSPTATASELASEYSENSSRASDATLNPNAVSSSSYLYWCLILRMGGNLEGSNRSSLVPRSTPFRQINQLPTPRMNCP